MFIVLLFYLIVGLKIYVKIKNWNKKKKAMKNLMKKYFRAVFKPSNSEIHFQAYY
jgi:hypothetical protein